MTAPFKLNVGCGRTPTEGWLNYDNSPSIRLARWPAVVALGKALRLFKRPQLENITFCRTHRIQFCDARKLLPVPDRSADVVYASHMVEHLDREEASAFLREAGRVLIPGGVLRLALPNLRWHVDAYLHTGDGNALMDGTKLGRALPKTLGQRVNAAIFGERSFHVWMYDPASAEELLVAAGFAQVRTFPPGGTMIPDPGHLNLSERSPESLFVEGKKT